jgi:hypothetical protein
MVEPRATKAGLPGWMWIAVRMVRKDSSHTEVGLQGVRKMDLRCPKCNSADLKRVSLACREGLFHVDTRTRMRGLLFAGGGPDILVRRTTTCGTQQSALSKCLCPPTKWSYLKLFLWSGVVTLIALVLYVQHVMATAMAISGCGL